MRYAIIENNIVTNIAVADEPLADNWFEARGCEIGDIWDGESFTAPPISEKDTESEWAEIRKRRNGLLSACDWTQLPDAPLTDADKTAWAEYRQALRDITEQADPFNITWPVAP